MKAKEKYSRLFVASISHDYRTNINIIIGNLETLSFKTQITQENSIYFTNIRNASSILTLLVQDLIDFSSLKEHNFKVNPSNYDFKELIQEMEYLYKIRYQDKNLYLKSKIDEDVPLQCFTDRLRIKQILRNLLSNSRKFSLYGGVTIQVSDIKKEQLFIIKVIDTGIGIAEEDISKLMKSFVKLEDKHHLNEN